MESSSYLMMLYVTLEQESALKDFFVDNGWKFCKPDLAVTTEELGPCVPCKKDPDEEPHFPDAYEDEDIKPSFPMIKMNAFLPKSVRKKTSMPVEGKRKGYSLRKPKTPAKRTRGTEAEDDIKIETDGDSRDFDTLNEDTDGDGDDDFRDEDDMDYDNEVETGESVGNTSGKGEAQLPTDIPVVNGDTVDDTATKTKEDKKTPTPVVCNICLKTFGCKKNLGKHMLRHGDKKFSCPICNKGFYRMTEMRKHIQYTHEGKRPPGHICDVCGKTYPSKSDLEIHYSYKHSAEPMEDLKCKVCGKVLSCKKKRIQHEQKHVEGFKFTKCDGCGRMCKNIEDHKQYCSGEPFTAKHECGDCGAMFTTRKYLQKHLKIKHGFTYACVACGLTFSDKKAVANHTCTSFNVVITNVNEEFS